MKMNIARTRKRESEQANKTEWNEAMTVTEMRGSSCYIHLIAWIRGDIHGLAAPIRATLTARISGSGAFTA